MRGVGRSSAAISIVNAIPTGIGCAHGVRLYAAAVLELEPRDTTQVNVEPAASQTPVVLRSLETAFSRLHPGGGFLAHLQLDSEIPVAKGLKSSSAVATATIRAAADALRSPLGPLEVARMAAQVGREVGVSATGAFDDALAGLVPGFVVTDNRTGELLRRSAADPDWTAVVHVPAGTHPASPSVAERFRRRAAEAEGAARSARDGSWSDAMEQNTILVERVMGYDYRDIRERLRNLGAVASGVSGLGPALVSLVPQARAPAVLDSLPPERFMVPLTSEEHP
ncbi:MAG: shikimate kinase [Thermoplasmata archaeon]